MPPGATAQDIALASLSFPGMPLGTCKDRRFRVLRLRRVIQILKPTQSFPLAQALVAVRQGYISYLVATLYSPWAYLYVRIYFELGYISYGQVPPSYFHFRLFVILRARSYTTGV
jgi:hypothetical protein